MNLWLAVGVVAVVGAVGWLVLALRHDLGDRPAKRAIEVLLDPPERR